MHIISKPFEYSIFCQEMSKRMPCQHGNAVPRLKGVKPNGSPWYRFQCSDCGAPLQPTQLKHVIVRQFEESGNCVQGWDNDSENRYLLDFYRNITEIRKIHGWDNQSWWQRYDQYLRSPKWRSLRLQILERDNYTCRLCSTNPATQVHHDTYERVGHEFCDDLLSVCLSCHYAFHNET